LAEAWAGIENEAIRRLMKLEFTLFKQIVNGNPVPDNTLNGPTYITGTGSPKVTVKVNGNTISN
jgi:hypothetical protein